MASQRRSLQPGARRARAADARGGTGIPVPELGAMFHVEPRTGQEYVRPMTPEERARHGGVELAYKADRVYLDGLTANERDAIALRLQEALGEDEYMALRPAGVGAGRLFAADMGPA